MVCWGTVLHPLSCFAKNNKKLFNTFLDVNCSELSSLQWFESKFSEGASVILGLRDASGRIHFMYAEQDIVILTRMLEEKGIGKELVAN